MEISTQKIDATTVLRVTGDLDTTTAPLLESAIDELLAAQTSRLLLNLEATGFVSSAGLRIFLGASKRLGASGGSLRLSNLNETVNEVFEISGFISILDVYGTEDEALKA